MKSKAEVSAAQRQAESQLRNASVRITEARVKVLAALSSAKRALSHQELQDSFVDMDRVTLYRALDCLTESGLAHKIPGDDRVFRYSVGAPDDRHNEQHQHGHFKCTRCSKVFCLDDIGDTAALENALQATLGKGFQSHDLEFTVKGWCAECAH